ncbi:MAG: TonB family protein [Pseudomonadota bacterium]
MILRDRGAGEFMVSCLLAVFVAGLLYVGILLLNEAPLPDGMIVVEGAVRLAQPERDRTEPEMQRRKPDEAKPPEELPKTFTSRSENRPVKPLMNMSVPDFSADLHPGLMGGVALPAGDFGNIGFTMDEVDDLPQVVRSVSPEYPFVAKRNRVEGEVVVRMLVDSEGRPQKLSIHSSTPAGVFDETALGAAERWRFKPGRYRGNAVDTWVLLPFAFELTP